jgi:hypothetical protein
MIYIIVSNQAISRPLSQALAQANLGNAVTKLITLAMCDTDIDSQVYEILLREYNQYIADDWRNLIDQLDNVKDVGASDLDVNYYKVVALTPFLVLEVG